MKGWKVMEREFRRGTVLKWRRKGIVLNFKKKRN